MWENATSSVLVFACLSNWISVGYPYIVFLSTNEAHG